ncbi:MAG: hypothetical protein UY31_C0042G0004 [Candidatus Wolfebacteria bacterium GW2011_GWE1_48_7]|uniref:Uncharacterized protein n=2 Tax=Candidatus Wolfeibacteriota TaxID=1752735 RepID=A0A0G1U6P4_9BACT|nr:MAG: hypothetical protein UX70_C0001G0900 [Candidatus Wolfebacteria bacterium GW2011_GWB1_47_1]KKU36132.1 MAG: hypothetical protein UX49_C0023G0009 [Candidatus Wolfebacteria bacterium GW2011_GWC2_46_275]KKU42185.1 MAG: hypothetical protein UX58_C0003G0110 [Candidatus Wolfebacteria bacterium GW2011_GWB2_46_69]KKU54039.1 MAG: hypothetical protein UX76_C0006G0004 [Candidatus Wolfebacteria bacterium GW2011_GWC1_47_103]KKU59464.1 MAG: hypothetical protein UX83_C0005G0083 [Candidatus Wolfebacteria
MTIKTFFDIMNHMVRRSQAAVIEVVICFALVCVGVLFVPELVNAQSTAAANPGQTGGELYTPRYLPPIVQGAMGPADLVFLIYKYLMGLVGIVAVGVIIYGGVLRTVSADIGKIKQSNEYIKNALKGIVLLFGAQVIFNTINPNIINISRIQSALQPKEKITPRQFTEIGISMTDEGATSTAITAAQTIQGAVNLYGGAKPELAAKLQSCVDCASPSFGGGGTFIVKQGACFGAGCQTNRNLIAALNVLQTKATAAGLQWRMTEGYPPTVDHMSSCHFNGTCVDIGLMGSITAARVNAFINAARAAGLNVVNEYSVGSNPQSFTTTTGGHLHVRL